MYFLVGKLVVSAGIRSGDDGKWVGDWAVSEEIEDGSLRVLEGGMSSELMDPLKATPESAVREGVEAARRIQEDQGLQCEPYMPNLDLEKPN